MKTAIQIVDSLQYVEGNCYQHQLLDALRRSCELRTVELRDVDSLAKDTHQGPIVSCLRLRVLDKERGRIARALAGRQLTVYDQDVWESFRTDGACRGAYGRIAAAIDVRAFAVTTHAWAARLQRRGFNSTFVPMGMLPRHCDSSPGWHERTVDVGFVGMLHPYRTQLFDALQQAGVTVELMSGGLSYPGYLDALSNIKVFVHREAYEYDVADEKVQYGEGLWIKDVEAVARGCVSVRNWHPDAYRHMPAGLIGNGLRMFEDGCTDDTVDMIRGALDQASDDSFEKERVQDVDSVICDDAWLKTAQLLVGEHVNREP